MRHVPGLRRLQGVEIVAVCNQTRESSEVAAKELNIPVVCDSWEELIARPDIDAVFVGTWPYMHHSISIAALRAGKHVFCQARLSMDGDEAREMKDVAHESGKIAMVCPVPIGLSIDQTIARILEDGTIGDVRLIRIQSYSDVFAEDDAPANWRKDHRLSGKNMHTLGMYIEVMHRWFGLTKALSAYTQIVVPERLTADGERIRVEIPDHVLINAEMMAGFPVQYTFSTIVYHGRDKIQIFGSKGTLSYDVWGDVLYLLDGEEGIPADIHEDDLYDTINWRVESDFVRAIREGASCHPTFEEGYHYMRVIDAVHESAKSGQRIELTY